jgi:hypothetical protein
VVAISNLEAGGSLPPGGADGYPLRAAPTPQQHT